MNEIDELDKDVRHFIYTTFAERSHPPSTAEAAAHFQIGISDVEASFERLADAHQIALAPGTPSVWMAHPFSGLPSNFVTRVAGKTYWGN